MGWNWNPWIRWWGNRGSDVDRRLLRRPYSLWNIPLAGLAVGLAPLARFWDFDSPESLLATMAITACIGLLGASLLLARDHIRSRFLAECVQWFGILALTGLICWLVVALGVD